MTLIHVECEMEEKMKKFKDFRVTVFMIIMIPALLALSIYSKVVWHSQMRFVLALIMTITIALICLAGYNLHLYSDIIMIYTWKYVALLPEMIEVKDIKSIKAVSKHKIKIAHKYISYAYVSNSQEFMENYQLLQESAKEQENM
mgnify:FL=1